MINWTPHRFRSADGRLELFARDYQGNGPSLLLMHGLTRNSADFEPLVRYLAGRYRLIVPDQRGRGQSQHDPDSANYRPDIYAADMFALLDRLGVERAGLIGTSMGGLMAMIMGATAPARVSCIVMNDIGPVVEEGGLDRIRQYVGPRDSFASWDAAAGTCAAINRHAFPGFGDADWMAFARRTCAQREDGRVGFAYDPAISSAMEPGRGGVVPPDLWPLWDMLDPLPVLVLRGVLSDLLSAATVEEMARRHSGPFRAVTVESRGHAPLLDEAEVLDAMLPFLQSHAA
jgi:pimeloyl-ACP methyl ester carboxylesterase